MIICPAGLTGGGLGCVWLNCLAPLLGTSLSITAQWLAGLFNQRASFLVRRTMTFVFSLLSS